jgi:rhamnose transport system permease protein
MRIIASKQSFDIKRFLFQWEWMLVVIIIVVFAINSSLSEYFLDGPLLVSATSTFLDKAFLVMPMVFIIILGDIDISVASIAALSSVIMAVSYNLGLPMPLAMLLCVAVSTVCGWINGLLIVKFKELSAVIVTLSTMIIYRGIAYIILEDQASGKFPAWFNYLGWGSVGSVPFILIVFILFALFFAFLLHKTTFGRRVYGMGSNITSSRFSGIQVDKVKIIVFTMAGFMAGITSLFLTSRMGSTRPNVALGYELDVITMVVLGGISTSGGKGRMLGAVMAMFLIGYLRYGLGLVNIPAQTLLIIIGGLLIFAVMVPNLSSKVNLMLTKKAVK